ncbi:hypothetical protein R3W88_024364 [Solanum pinnatisectum]|uniref:Ubiquitin-like protease family profile domain-containing protein n=1 Tax=Solanum pinnatisectum TaxID=50273 RepID=A0AAV9M0C9_9SOLN|nr:hypothetical protein R3W88_024364 [Solanum pinnatisectum]
MPFYTICGRSRSNKVILNIDIPLLIVFLKTYIGNVSVVPENENKIIDTSKGFGIPARLSWQITYEVYIPINCNGELHWVLTVVVLKERCIKVFDSMSSSKTNRKLSVEIQKLSRMCPKYLESNGFFEQEDRTDWSVLESYQGKKKSHPFEVIHVTDIAQQVSNNLLWTSFASYAEFLSDGLQVPSCGIISQSFHMRYASLLWNYRILKARSGYVSNNEDPQRSKPKKEKCISPDENVVVTTID